MLTQEWHIEHHASIYRQEKQWGGSAAASCYWGDILKINPGKSQTKKAITTTKRILPGWSKSKTATKYELKYPLKKNKICEET